jgi:hypothetical protein
MDFENFRTAMLVSIESNEKVDTTVNWNFVDADLWKEWAGLLGEMTYMNWFDKVADEVVPS